jgi:HAD superfamily hydrolase (TIGR01549 family)
MQKNPCRHSENKFKNIKCVIFDLDGTLFDAPYDWKEIKRALGVPDGEIILSYLKKLPEEERAKRFALLEKFEQLATKSGTLKSDAKELIHYLHETGIKVVLVTNNSMFNTNYILQKYGLSFDFVLTRDSGLYKPGKEVIEFVLNKMKVLKEQALLVGDSDYDLQTAKLSGIPLILVGDRIPNGEFTRVKHLRDIKTLIG